MRRLNRRELLRTGAATGLLAATSGIVAACQPANAPPTASAAAAAAPRVGGTATYASSAALGDILLANLRVGPPAVIVTTMTFESLLQYDEKLNLQPMLAERWDLSSDKRTHTFHLRKDAKWSDGKPITAADVEATVLALTDPKLADARPMTNLEEIVGALDRKAGKRTDVPGVQVVDPQTVRVTTIQPSGTFLDAFAAQMLTGALSTGVGILPKHIIDTIPMDQIPRHPFTKEPKVSSGPFTVVRYDTAAGTVELARNVNYWGPRPNLDRVFVRVMPSDAALIAMERGEVDIVDNLEPDDAERIAKNPDVTVTSYPGLTINQLFIQVESKPQFKDPRFRQALMYAIDREKMLQTLLKGRGKVAYSVYPAFHPWYNIDGLNKYAYDPEKAKQLLKEVGWPSGQQVRLVAQSNDKFTEQAVPVIQQYLLAVGVATKIEQVDQATLISKNLRAHDFDFVLLTQGGGATPDLSRRFSTRAGQSGQNYGLYSNPELDKLMDEVRSKTTLAEIRPLSDQIQRIINRDMPYTHLFLRDVNAAVNTKRLGGAVPSILGYQRLFNPAFLKQ